MKRTICTQTKSFFWICMFIFIIILVSPALNLDGTTAAPATAGASRQDNDKTNPAIQVLNHDFETADEHGMPANWHQLNPRPRINGSVHHHIPAVANNGRKISSEKNTGRNSSSCLLLEHKEATRSTVASPLLSLKTGHLYRLSGWIQTENAHTDPILRYPTPVAACMTMASFPFTNHSQAVGGSSDWQEISTLFIATQAQDQICLHLGFNGPASGKARFDDIRLQEVSDISAYIPMETVRWFGPAYRYDDKGWTFIHIEGQPYQRGYQHGYLLAEEITAYIAKLAYEEDQDDPSRGWEQLRRLTDTVFLRGYETEFLEEMKGTADGAAKNSAVLAGRPLDLLDIVTLNSVIDIGQLDSALPRNDHALSGRSFLKAEEELQIPLKAHKCSGFTTSGAATTNGEIVFGQLFMWGGYTGVHWNVICDLQPGQGHRLVYETFPGGIHSGADIYVNDAGIMIGETTVSQTPFEIDSTPQSNRIRKAAQYASSIDDVVNILETKNNGMYTNDWLLGDAKTNEVGIFLLGTHKSKLWRSSTGDFPGDTSGFFWSNNNNKDLEVRKEYIHNADNAPFDLVFNPWNRDIAFYEFYQQYKGKIDAIAGVDLWASSPMNRPHACDGKITTTEMAKNLMFLAHFGKVTLREKFPHKDNRNLRDYPGALPHLSLGYSVVAPKWITANLQDLKKKQDQQEQKKAAPAAKNNNPGNDKKDDYDLSRVKEVFAFEARHLWHNTVYPGSDRENWFISGTAAYWRMLQVLPGKTKPVDAVTYLAGELASLNNQLLYTVSREKAVAPIDARTRYDCYGHYRIPRIRGTYALHQLRLYLGNEVFSKVMNQIHENFQEKPITTENIIAAVGKIAGGTAVDLVKQWIERSDLPQPLVKLGKTSSSGKNWRIELSIEQPGNQPPYHFFTTAAVETTEGTVLYKIEVSAQRQTEVLSGPGRPVRVTFNAGNDIPVRHRDFYTWSNMYDDFYQTLIVYGTNRQVEANHTLALRFQERIADRSSELLLPLRKDSEISKEELAGHDLIIVGGSADNSLLEKIVAQAQVELVCGKNYFTWQGKTYGQSDDGLIVVIANPYNPEKVAYLVIANSALQLYQMTDQVFRLPAWALFKKNQIVKEGNHHPVQFILPVN